MAQQTAVEILIDKIYLKDKNIYWELIDELQESKEMEKKQKIEFAKLCLNKALDTDVRTAYKDVEKYYNETHGGNE